MESVILLKHGFKPSHEMQSVAYITVCTWRLLSCFVCLDLT